MRSINAQSSQATMFDFTSLWSRNKKEANCEKTSDSNSEKQSAPSISTSSHFNTNIDNNIATAIINAFEAFSIFFPPLFYINIIFYISTNLYN